MALFICKPPQKNIATDKKCDWLEDYKRGRLKKLLLNIKPDKGGKEMNITVTKSNKSEILKRELAKKLVEKIKSHG